jgi:hypothetical protein
MVKLLNINVIKINFHSANDWNYSCERVYQTEISVQDILHPTTTRTTLMPRPSKIYSQNAKIDFLYRYKYRYDHTKNFWVLFLKILDKYIQGLRIWNSKDCYSAQHRRLKITKLRQVLLIKANKSETLEIDNFYKN